MAGSIKRYNEYSKEGSEERMIGRNMRYYRIRAGKSATEVSRELGISRQRLKRYEDGDELPEMKIARNASAILGVSLAELMMSKSFGHKYEHCEYRKHSRFTRRGQEQVDEFVEDYLDRFFAVTEILGGKVLREFPEIHSIKPSFDAEIDASKLRGKLGFAACGAIPNLITSVEDKGILIIQMWNEDEKFFGKNGLADGRPYIVLNSRTTAERQRSTLVHELGHIYFEPPFEDTVNWERHMTAVSGAFLLTRVDILNELGETRKGIGSDMLMVCREYGISLQMLAKRAKENGIITDRAYRWFNISLNRAGQKRREPSNIKPESSLLMEQLVLRAVVEGSMSAQRGAELLRISYAEMEGKIYPKAICVLDGIDKQ